MMPQEIEPAVEAALLRGVFDNQPVCLLRLRTDGVVLSANDAALALVGADELSAIVGHVFTGWVVPDHHIAWRTFLQQVSEGATASLQCDMLAPGGRHQTTLLHGVPLDEHPDGVRSIAVAIRTSNSPYIVSSSHDHDASKSQGQDDRSAATPAETAERQQLEAMVRELENRLKRLTDEYEAVRNTRAAQPMTPQAAGVANQRQTPQVFDEFQILTAVRETSVWHQLEASIAEREAVLTQLESDLTGTRAELERATVEGQRLAAEWAADRAKLEAFVEQGKNGSSHPPATASQDASSDGRQALLEQTVSERQAAQAELEQSAADRDRLEALIQTLEVRHQDVLAEHALEIKGFEERLNALSAAVPENPEAAQGPDQSLLAELEASLAEREETVSRLAGELNEARSALEHSRAEGQRLETIVREREGQSPKSVFQTILKGPALELARTRAELDRVSAERRRLASALRNVDAQQQRLAATRAADRADFERRLQAVAVEHESERVAAVQAREQDRAQAERERLLLEERDREVARARTELEQELIERQRLDASIADLEARTRQLVATSNAERADVEQLFDALVVQHQAELRATHEAHQLELATAREGADRLEEVRRQMEAELSEVRAKHGEVAAAARDERSQLIQQLESERIATRATATQASADKERFEARVRELELSQQQLDIERAADRAALEQALGEGRRLEGLVLELQGGLRVRETAHANEVAALERRFDSLLTEHHIALDAAREASDERERDAARERDALLNRSKAERHASSEALDQAQAENRRLSETLHDVEIKVQQTEAARASAQSRVEEAITDNQRLKTAIGELQAERSELGASHGRKRAELEQRLEMQAADHEDRLRAAHQATEQHHREADAKCQTLQRQFDADRTAARAELDQARVEHQQLQAAIADLEATLRHDKMAHAADRTALEQRLDELVAEHQTELRAARQTAELHEREAALEREERKRLQEQSDADRAAARATLDQAVADGQQQAAALSDLHQRYERLAASSADLRAIEENARQRDDGVAQQSSDALLQVEAQLASTRTELERALAGRHGLEVALEELKARQDRIAESRAEDCSRIRQLEQELASERRAGPARDHDAAANGAAHQSHLSRTANVEAERARLARAVADYEIAMQALADNARRLAPLAAAGRVALEVGTQLRDLIEDVDLRSARILAQCDLDSPERGDLERLRARAISVAALAHEILDSGTETTDCPTQPLGRARARRSASRR